MKNFVVFGDGIYSRITSLWLAKQINLKNSKSQLTLISPQSSSLATLDFCLPPDFNLSIMRFLDIDEKELISKANLSFNLATRIAYSKDRENKVFFQLFDEQEMLNSYYFLLQHWIQERSQNISYMSFDQYFFPQKILFERSKAPKMPDYPDYTGLCHYGLNFNYRDLLNFLDLCCENAGINLVTEKIRHVDRKEDQSIYSLTLSNQNKLEVDLLFNCHPKPIAALQDESSFDYLQKDPQKLLEISYQPPSVIEHLDLFSELRLDSMGYLQSFNLMREKHIRYTCSASFSETQVAQYLLKNYQIDVKKHQHQWHSIHKHKLQKAWESNVINLCSAYATIDPLISHTSFSLLSQQLQLLSLMFPSQAIEKSLANTFNKATEIAFTSILDIQAIIHNHTMQQDTPYSKAFTKYLADCDKSYHAPLEDPPGIFSKFFIDSLLFNLGPAPEGHNPLISYSQTKEHQAMLRDHLHNKYNRHVNDLTSHSQFLLNLKTQAPKGLHG